MTYDDIAKIFEEIELSLISSLRRNLAGHKAWEKEEGFDWSAWQAEKLKNIERFRRENQAIMNLYKKVIDSDTLLLMEEQFKEGEELAKQQLAEQLHTDENEQEEVPIPDEHFFGVNNEKMDKLMSDITTIEQKAETAALRMTDDVYRQTLYKVQLAMGTGSMTLQQAIDSAVKDFLDKGINCIVYRDGRRVNISDYVRMALRTTSTRAKLQGQAKQLSELGYDTVIISTYGKCSDTCLPWQGRVYIDDVFTPWQGEQNGDIGKSNYCGKWFPLLSTAVKGGLFHPNCRHTMLQYIDGITKPPEVLDEEKIKDLYRKEQKLRALERNVRKAKRKVNGCSDAENIKKAKEELKKAQRAVKDFIEQTNQSENKTIFKRDYGREKVYSGETNGNISSLGVANSENSGTITLKDASAEWIPITIQSINSIPNISEFKSIQLNELVRTESCNLLRNLINDELGTEATVSINLKNLTHEFRKGEKGEGGVKFIHMDSPYISIHNHPSGETFSVRDLEILHSDSNCNALLVVGNNGKIYIMQKQDTFDSTGFFEYIMKKKYGFSKYHTEYDFMKGAEKYGVKYYERTN